MYLFRALNEFDIETNPIKNGIASKSMIYDLTNNYYKNDKEFISLSKKEKDIFIKKKMINYIKTHNINLEKKFLKYNRDINKSIESILNIEDLFDDEESFMKVVYYLSTLNNHLINGNKVYTNWISFSKKIDAIKDYFDSGNIHKIAIIESRTNNLIDGNTYAIDLSDKDFINNNEIFLNKIDNDIYKKYLENKDSNLFVEDLVHKTNKKFMGYNFATAKKEVCYYGYVPSNRVKAIIDNLQYDLITYNLFNEEFINLSIKEQIKRYKELKEKILIGIKLLNNPFMLHVYDEVYLKNKSVDAVTSNIFEKEKIEINKKYILGIASRIPDIEIKVK